MSKYDWIRNEELGNDMEYCTIFILVFAAYRVVKVEADAGRCRDDSVHSAYTTIVELLEEILMENKPHPHPFFEGQVAEVQRTTTTASGSLDSW